MSPSQARLRDALLPTVNGELTADPIEPVPCPEDETAERFNL